MLIRFLTEFVVISLLIGCTESAPIEKSSDTEQKEQRDPPVKEPISESQTSLPHYGPKPRPALDIETPCKSRNCVFVSTDGYNENPGTQESPWETIQFAADNAPAGSLVIIEKGVYDERVVITKGGDSNSPTTFYAHGDDLEVEVVLGFRVYADYVRVEGFHISFPIEVCDDLDAARTSQQGIIIDASDVTVAYNRIERSAGAAVWLKSTSANATVMHNRLWRNIQTGIHLKGKDHLIHHNEIWETVMRLESSKGDGVSCSYNDADGIRFWGHGHQFSSNYIHDIRHDHPEVDNAHIDCWQTYYDPNAETPHHIEFDSNYCDVLTSHPEDAQAHGTGWQLDGSHDLEITHNVIRATKGINIYKLHALKGAENILIQHNTLIGFGATEKGPAHHTAIHATDQLGGIEVSNNVILDFDKAFTGALNSVKKNCILRSAPGQTDGDRYKIQHWDEIGSLKNPGNFDFRLESQSPLVCAALGAQPLTTPN